jgi:hypothetical protein
LDISSKVFICRQGKHYLSSQEPEIKNAMSQKANTYLILPETSEELIASEPWSIETYADGLMDELFAEIDLILDGSDQLSSQTMQPHGSHLKSGNPPTVQPQEYIRHVQTVTVPQIVVPETQLRPIQKVPQARNNPLSTLVVSTPAVSRPISKAPQKSQRTKGLMLWVGITIGVAAASVLWVLNSGLLNRLVSKSLQQSLLESQVQPQLPTKAQIEADLVQYMLGALAVIDKQEAKSNLRSAKPVLTAATPANQTALAYITPQGVGYLPTPVAVNHVPPAPSNPTKVVERIYIPVYQAPQPMRYALPPVAGTLQPLPSPAKVPQKNVATTPKPAPVKVAQNKAQQSVKPVTSVQALAAVRPELKAVAVAKPMIVQQAPQPVPSPSVVASSVALPKPAPALETQEVASGITTPDIAAVSHTLEGLLELGSKSAALFKVNGVTRRVEVGEAIGSSGWTLVEVANGEAVIRRNGEVRSIYAGQTF